MIEQQLEKMQNLTNAEIKKLFEKYFNYTIQNRPREFYIENIGYRMQELEFGGLPMKTRQLLDKMSTASTVKSSKPRVAPVGTKIVKNYKGTDYVVRVLEEGFELNGQWFKSLSGISISNSNIPKRTPVSSSISFCNFSANSAKLSFAITCNTLISLSSIRSPS